MKTYALSHLSDPVLLRDLATLVARDRATTAELLAHIAEVDARKLYLPAAYESMFAYCVRELHLCEQAAFKRILAARTARRFPAIFAALADGRLHLSAVVLLAPHLTEETAAGLLAAATHRTKAEIEQLLAERFPKSDVLAWVVASPAPSLVPLAGGATPPSEGQLSPGIVGTGAVRDRSMVKPLSARSFEVKFTMSLRGHDQLSHAQDLLGHQVPPGDFAAVIERALDALVERLEKSKYAATERPRTKGLCPTRSARHVPAHVRRAVRERDGGRCTFVSESGRRCEARRGVRVPGPPATA